MTITEKHRTEYRLIDQVLSELTQVMQKIETLEAAAEKHRKEAEELRESDATTRKVNEQLKEQFVQEKTKSEGLSMDLEKMTAQRNQLQVEIQDLRENMKTQTDIYNTEREKLMEDLQRETAQRKEAVERFRNSLSQMQDLMDSVQSLMGPSDRENQPEER